jgi:hypothetical protein
MRRFACYQPCWSSPPVGCAALAAPPYDLVIAEGRAMDPETGLDAIRYIGIRDLTIWTG